MSKVWKQKQGLFCVLERVAESQLTPERGDRRGHPDPVVGSLHTVRPGPWLQDEVERLPEESLPRGRQHAKGGGSPSRWQKWAGSCGVWADQGHRDTGTSGTQGLRPLAWAEVPGVDLRGWALSWWFWPACLKYPGPVQLCRVGLFGGPATSPLREAGVPWPS